MTSTTRMIEPQRRAEVQEGPVDLDLVRVLPDERADRDGDDEEEDDLDADAAALRGR